MSTGNGQHTVWQWSCESLRASAKDIVNELSALGMAVTDWTGRPEIGPGIVFIAEVTPAIGELIHFASDGGRNQVLAILDNPCVHAEDIEPLLANGADDVLVRRVTDKEIATAVLARICRREEAKQIVVTEQAAGNCIGSGSRWRMILEEIVESTAFSELPVLLNTSLADD